MAWEHSENVSLDVGLIPSRVQGRTFQKVLSYRDDLFSDQNPQKTRQRNEWRRWGTHANKAIDHADQDAGCEGDDVHLHDTPRSVRAQPGLSPGCYTRVVIFGGFEHRLGVDDAQTIRTAELLGDPGCKVVSLGTCPVALKLEEVLE